MRARRREWIRVVLLLSVCTAGRGASADRPARAPHTRGAEASSGSDAHAIRSSSLPDSVLAQVDSGRVITVSAFLEARNRAADRTSLGGFTPIQPRQFLDLLVDQEVLATVAAKESWVWTAEESAGYRTLRDRLVVQAALDSAMFETAKHAAAAGESLDADALGALTRDSTVARLGVGFDTDRIERLARTWSELPRPSPDSSLASQIAAISALPVVAPADSHDVDATSSLGPYRANDLLGAWRRLSPAYRPRIESPGQVRDLVSNGLFERALRRQAELGRLDLRPEIERTLARERERVSVLHLIEREIGSTLPADSVAERRFYDQHPERWVIETRVRLMQLVLDERAAANRMALALRDPAEAESLTDKAKHAGLDYVVELRAEEDSSLFSESMRIGPGQVIGPTQTTGGWRVVRVIDVLPGRPRRYDEVRDQVQRAWANAEGERRMRALCGQFRRRVRVRVNERALAELDDHAARP